MKIQEAQRLQDVCEYYFAQKLQEIADLEKQGHRVINLGIGSPDLPPHSSVIAALSHSAQNPQNHAYQPYRGVLPLWEAIATWMERIYGVSLEASQEILPLMDSKEGIFHIAMAFLNPNDKVLVPNPAYPAYATVSRMTGAEVCFYQL